MPFYSYNTFPAAGRSEIYNRSTIRLYLSSSSATRKEELPAMSERMHFSRLTSKLSLCGNRRRKAKHGQSIPEFVVTMIVKFLSARERRNVRLVCNKWYDACREYEKREKFCIGSASNDKNCEKVFATLSKSTRQYFDFEFYGFIFIESHAEVQFWENCGPRICSIKLVNCHLSGPSFDCILRHCSGLQTFEINFADLSDMGEKIAIKVPNSTIPSYQKNGSVRTLKIRFAFHDLLLYEADWRTVLRTLFEVFPNMTHFSMSEDALIDKELGHYVESSTLEKYFVRDRMKCIAMNFLTHLYINPESKKTKVTEIAVPIDMFVKVGDMFFTHIRELPHISKVTGVTTAHIERTLIDQFVSGVLRIPNLREFQLFLRYDESVIEWTNNWSKLLFASKVECLRLMSENMTFLWMPSDSYPSNPYLSSFVVRVEESYSTDIVRLLNSFPKLRNLSLSHVNSTILESVSINQVELQSFTTGKVMSDEISTFSGMDRLKKLKNFSMSGSLRLAEGTHFDHLIHLCISDVRRETYFSIDINNFEIYRSLSTTLEVVWLDYFVIKTPPELEEKRKVKWFVNIICNFVASQKSLRVLYFDPPYPEYHPTAADIMLTKADACTVFKSCPSLEIFVYRDQFVRDVITKRIRKCPAVDSQEVLERYLGTDSELNICRIYRELFF